MKKTWRTINETLNRKKKNGDLPTTIFHDNVNCQMPRKLLQHSIHALQTLEKN